MYNFFLDCSPVLGIDVIPVTKHKLAAPFHMYTQIDLVQMYPEGSAMCRGQR